MSLDVERTLLHQRQIALRFFQRADGYFEVEGRLTDRKTQPFRRQLAEEDAPAGAALHDITVTLVIDGDMRVRHAAARMQATPFDLCGGAERTLAPLVGLTIGAGWNRTVRSLLGGAASCTHIVELLGPMATTAFQGLAPLRMAAMRDPANEADRRAKVDSCYAYAAHRPVVARLWPHLHRPPPNPGN